MASPPNAGLLQPELIGELWRASPAATAATLSRDDRDPWMPAPHLLLISRAIRNAVTGTGPKFNIITMPPRHGKSFLISKWTPVWFLDNFPHKKIIMCGYGASFAADWGREVRNLTSIHQARLRYTLSDDSKAQNKWNTVEGGGMRTAGVGGDITGKGADILILDDVIKNYDEAESFTFREKVWNWYTSTARTRLEPGGCIFVLMTRWHEDDLVGRLLSPEYGVAQDWNVLDLPAICEGPGDPCWSGRPDPIGREPGDALWPARYDRQALDLLKRSVTDENWFSLYQQHPARLAGKGNVYDSYSASENVMRCERDIELPLFWSLDFNRDPMCSVIGQNREIKGPYFHLNNEKLVTCEVLQEMYLPDCSTYEACQEFINRSRRYVNAARGRRVALEIYGDVSGNQGHTSGDQTDWEIVRQFFQRYPEFLVTYHVGIDNPAVKARTNAVNTALKTADGYRRLLIDIGCRELQKDMSEVKWKRDSGGNTMGVIDKSDRKRSHLSDALGYVIVKRFGIQSVVGERNGLMQ